MYIYIDIFMGCEAVADTSYSFFDFHRLEIWRKKKKQYKNQSRKTQQMVPELTS